MPSNAPARKRGRPAFVPTAAQRRQVSIAASTGMKHDEIAVAVGISDETLRKYFAHELSAGAWERRMEVISAMHKAAAKGSVPAARLLLQYEPNFVPGNPVPAAEPAAAAPVGPKLGKKEQAAIDAVTAAKGTAWDDLLPGSSSVQ